MRGPAAVAEHGRQVQRAHARLDQVESTTSKQTSDISTNATNITTANTNIALNTTAIAAINTRLGAANMAFLATIGQMSHYNETATGGWTTGGALGAGTWDATHANALVTWMDQVTADIGAILSRLTGENYMA